LLYNKAPLLIDFTLLLTNNNRLEMKVTNF
jgi:hypothetical protein